MRLYVASLRGDNATIDGILDEVGNCAVCFRAMLHMLLAMSSQHATVMSGGDRSVAISVAENVLETYASNAAEFTYDGVVPSVPPQLATAPQNPSSIPVYTVQVGDDLTLTVIRVDGVGLMESYQLYAITAEAWSLTGLFGLYVDALSEILKWRAFVGQGGTLSSWMADHPDGVEGSPRHR